MNFLDKNNWSPTLYFERFVASSVKDHLFDHFGWECHIDAQDGWYAVRLPANLTPEEYCLGQSFLLAYAHGFADCGLRVVDNQPPKDKNEKPKDQTTHD